jgi:hypothetical protein
LQADSCIVAQQLSALNETTRRGFAVLHHEVSTIGEGMTARMHHMEALLRAQEKWQAQGV